MVAFWLVLWLVMPTGFWGQLVAFALFRFFDAAKPGPVALGRPGLSSALAGLAAAGFGILFDDLVAAFCTLLVIALWRAGEPALCLIRCRHDRFALGTGWPTRCSDAAGCMATAESCTGGLIAAACTDLAGSSDWFERGFVTYSNAAKTEMLGVRRRADRGARRGQRGGGARHGRRRAARTRARRLAVAVTGVAGPDRRQRRTSRSARCGSAGAWRKQARLKCTALLATVPPCGCRPCNSR